MTHNVFLKCAAMLEVAFGAQPQARHALYEDRLSDVDDASLCAAISLCIDELDAFPTVHQIRDRLPGCDTKAINADAWARVIRAATSDVYVEHSPGAGTFPTGEKLTDDEFAAACGYDGLCRIRDAIGADDTRQLSFIRREFEAAYQRATNDTARPLLAHSDRPKLTQGSLDVKRLSAGLGATK